MKINLISGCTLYEATKNTIKEIDFKNMDEQNLVVVPDAFSMQAESLIFDVLDIKSTFNISVVGISRLASKILRDNNIFYDRISGLEEILYTYKAVKNNEENFVYFKNFGIDFCMKVLQIIKQFSNCNLRAEDIKSCDDKVLNAKMQDLKLIYSCYENLLEERLDLSKLLEFFLDKNIDLSNFNLYFVNFDSFSKEIFDFICKLSSKAKSVSIAVAKPMSFGNAYIFETDTTDKLFALAKEQDVTISVKDKRSEISEDKKAVISNVFSIKPEERKSDYFANFIASDYNDEVETVAKLIRYQIAKGERFKNFSIAIPDEKYFKRIKKIFMQYEIPVYMDYTLSLNEVAVSQFFIKILEIAFVGFDKNNIEYLLSSPFLNIENYAEKIKEMEYLDIDNLDELTWENDAFDDIVKIIKNLKKCEKTAEFCENSLKIVDFLNNNIDLFLNLVASDIQKVDENRQAVELIGGILQQIKSFKFDEKMTLEDFIFLIKTVFESMKIETVPAYIDAVYVGDVTKSYFEDVDFLFVLGATSSNLPKTEKDIGIINDEDIAKLKNLFLLEPEVRTMNRRNRLKLFEVLQHANKHLYVFTPTGGEDKKAGFVDDLLTAFGKNNIVNTSSFTKFDRSDLDSENLQELLFFNLGYGKVAESNFKKIENALPLPLRNAASDSLSKDVFNYDYERLRKIELAKVSASQLETYFSCPFKHFVSYLLKIKPFEYAKEDKRKVGILKHALAKNFVTHFDFNIKNLSDKDIEKFLNAEFLEESKRVFQEKTLKNTIFMKILKDECFSMLSNIVYEQSNSKFDIKYVEKYISSNILERNIVGFIDRVDETEKYFRIIDYKTGEVGAVLKDLYYGKKLQLFLYGKIYAEKSKKICAGLYYFDCKNKYKKKNVATKMLDGVTLKENEVVTITDQRLENEGIKSDLIGSSRRKTASSDGFEFKNGNFVESFDKYFDYVVDVSKKAISEIENGYIKPKPLAQECEMCKFRSICKFNLDETRSKNTVGEF